MAQPGGKRRQQWNADAWDCGSDEGGDKIGGIEGCGARGSI